MTSRSLMTAATLLLGAMPAAAQYVATAQAGVGYPALTTPSTVALVAPGTNDAMDRGRTTVPLGFEVRFYDRTYTSLTVTANGMAFFEPSSGANSTADFPANVAIPNGAEPNGLLAPLWDDLVGDNPTSALRSQAVTGSNGAGLAVEWAHWNRAFGKFDLTFQLRVWENGIIEFFYGPMTGSGSTALSATVGLEAPSGTAGVNALSGCTNDCDLVSFDPGGTGTPVSYVRFGPRVGVDLQAMRLVVDGISEAAGQLSIGTTLTLRNFGTQPSGAFGYRLYLSDDVVWDAADIELTPSPRGPFTLSAMGVVTDVAMSTASLPSGGSWYVLAVLDDDDAVSETNEFNNVATSAVAYAAGVDLVAQSVEPPAVAGPGDPVAVKVRFANQGFTPAGPVAVKLYASVDANLTPDDRLLHQEAIVVGGGQQVEQTVTFPLAAGIPPDNYFVVLQLDDGPAAGAIEERSDDNNVVTSVAHMQVRQADLVVTEVRVRDGVSPWNIAQQAFFGEPVRLEALVANVGGAVASQVSVAFFLSDNERLNAATDVFIGGADGLTFPPGTSQWVEVTAPVPTHSVTGVLLRPQAYFIFGAAVGDGLAESDTNNNFIGSSPLVVRDPAPNLTAYDVRAPALVAAGEVVPVVRTLANSGSRAAPPATYRYYLSANDIISPSDVPLTIVTQAGDVAGGVVTLGAGAQDTAVELVRLPLGVPEGVMYLGVLLDPDGVIEETREDDNGLAGRPLQVSALSLALVDGPLPDGLVGLPYDAQLLAAGALAAPSFRLKDDGEAPPGLRLEDDGRLVGVPTQLGLFGFTVVLEADGRTVEARRVLRVSAATASLVVTTVQLPTPVRNAAYDVTLGAAGGVKPYRWEVASGHLPQGLVLDAGGRISGVPELEVGDVSDFTLAVRDVVGNVDRRAYRLELVERAPFRIETYALSSARLGEDYLQRIATADASGAPVQTPVRWAVSGRLPAGLSAEPGTTELLTVAGTPSEAGLFEFSVEAVDARGRADTMRYVLLVEGPAPRLRISLPEVVLPGAEVSAAFSASPPVSGARYFVRDGRLPPGLSMSPEGVISGQVAADAPLASYAISVGYGPSADALVSMATVGLAVSDRLPESPSGCASVPGPGGWLLPVALALWGPRRRRRFLLC